MRILRYSFPPPQRPGPPLQAFHPGNEEMKSVCPEIHGKKTL